MTRLGLLFMVAGFAVGIAFNQHYAVQPWYVTRSNVNSCIKGDKLSETIVPVSGTQRTVSPHNGG